MLRVEQRSLDIRVIDLDRRQSEQAKSTEAWMNKGDLFLSHNR